MDWKRSVILAAAGVAILSGVFGASSWGKEWLRSVLHPLPEGTMLPFNSSSGIPAGWELCKSSDGRFLLGTDSAGKVGVAAEPASVTVTGAIEWVSEGTADQGKGRDLHHTHEITLPVIRVQFICKE